MNRSALALVLISIGCGAPSPPAPKAVIGGACTTKGTSVGCVDGAVCDTVKDNRVICLKICTKDEDCTSPQTCTGVSGATGKACHDP